LRNVVRVLRAEKAWSQAELAERLGVTRQTINAIEGERSDVRVSLAMRLARVFGVRVEDVFSLHDQEAMVWDTLDQHAGS
jgi:putative transcriptional regulator